jgi:CheY-like chemotaxis protein
LRVLVVDDSKTMRIMTREIHTGAGLEETVETGGATLRVSRLASARPFCLTRRATT